MNLIATLIVVLLPSILVGAERPALRVFEMHLVSEAATTNTDRMTISTNWWTKNAQKAEEIHVSKTIVLDIASVRSARLGTNPVYSTPEIAIEFTEQGKEHLAEITRNNVGKRIAILVNGKIRGAPRIMVPITTGRFAFGGPPTFKEADAIVRVLEKASKK